MYLEVYYYDSSYKEASFTFSIYFFNSLYEYVAPCKVNHCKLGDLMQVYSLLITMSNLAKFCTDIWSPLLSSLYVIEARKIEITLLQCSVPIPG